MPEIQVKAKIEHDFLFDVLETASQCIPWAESPTRSDKLWGSTRALYGHQAPNGLASIRWLLIRPTRDEGTAFPDGDPRNEFQVISWKKTKQAIEKILQGKGIQVRPDIRASIMSGVLTNDAGAIDAEVADVIVQVAAFGEIVFG